MSNRDNALVGAAADKLREAESAQLLSVITGFAEWLIIFFALAACCSVTAWLLWRQRETEREAAAERERTARVLEILAASVDRLTDALREKKDRRRRRA